MSIIVNQENPDPVTQVTFPQPGCCDLDEASRQALFAYTLSLILKQLGGADLTNCSAALQQFASYGNFDQAHAELVEWQLLLGLATLTGTTLPDINTLRAESACLRNNMPVWGLQFFQFVLWDEIVNTYIP
jgi:hypothetical protein